MSHYECGDPWCHRTIEGLRRRAETAEKALSIAVHQVAFLEALHTTDRPELPTTPTPAVRQHTFSVWPWLLWIAIIAAISGAAFYLFGLLPEEYVNNG
jgi:hypothetical protein